jgi:NAD(P)-dependent dehydrogenase (short-subunit alcohol dehydrogenase family)
MSGPAPEVRSWAAAPLAGRTPLVTGAGRGIGAGIARRLAADGARVVVADRDLPSAQEVAAGISAMGHAAVFARMDVSDEQERSDAFSQAEALGGLDILVNNAGIYTAQPVLDVDASSWHRVFEVNVQGLFSCCQAAIPAMLDQGRGRIVNLSSTATRIGNPTMIAYNASKAAVLAITSGLASEYGRQGITVNSVLPRVVDTPMWHRGSRAARVRARHLDGQSRQPHPGGKGGYPGRCRRDGRVPGVGRGRLCDGTGFPR